MSAFGGHGGFAAANAAFGAQPANPQVMALLERLCNGMETLTAAVERIEERLVNHGARLGAIEAAVGVGEGGAAASGGGGVGGGGGARTQSKKHSQNTNRRRRKRAKILSDSSSSDSDDDDYNPPPPAPLQVSSMDAYSTATDAMNAIAAPGMEEMLARVRGAAAPKFELDGLNDGDVVEVRPVWIGWLSL